MSENCFPANARNEFSNMFMPEKQKGSDMSHENLSPNHIQNEDAAQKFIKNFFFRSIVFMAAIVAIVMLTDPFFHYHKPWFGLKAVLTDKEYQCIGSLRTFDYDSVIAGSSVAENYNNGWFDEGFRCHSIKAIRSYGATADLCYFLDAAYEKHDLKYVFYNMDTSALAADPFPTFELTGCPMYLYDENIFNDVEYLFNKGVLMEKIPYMIANSIIGDYDENNSYNWAQWKEFNQDMALGLYMRKAEIDPMKEKDFYQDALDGNISLIRAQAENHPETQFKIFFPAYSMLFWDNLYRTGDLEAYLYNMEQAAKALLSYENVEIYYFQDDTEIITNLENYMDTLHFSPEINRFMAEQMIAQNEAYRLTTENYAEKCAGMRALSYRIVDEYMLPYVDFIKVDYGL